jgi:hypothetical protein
MSKKKKKFTLVKKFALVKKSSRRPRSAQTPALTPAELAEAARFREMTAARAAHKAMLYRLMVEMTDDLDEASPAA